MRQAEVGDAGVVVSGEENVGGFYVAVNGSGAALRVQIREASGSSERDPDPAHPVEGRPAAASVAVEERREAAHGHVIVHQELFIFGVVKCSQGNQVAVLQPPDHLNLRLEVFSSSGDIFQSLHG